MILPHQYLLSNWCVTHSIMVAVTFLALGNGAPDISSSIAAVSAGQYKLDIGSLLGIGLAVTILVSSFIACHDDTANTCTSFDAH